MIERNDFVRVTSIKEQIRGRYDGVDYEFRPGQPVDLHLIVARHIFGFSLEDKAAALARLGWASTSDAIPAALTRLANVRFAPSPPLVDAPDPMPETDPSAAERVPNRTSGSSPLALGGEAGVVASSSTAPAEPPRQKKA